MSCSRCAIESGSRLNLPTKSEVNWKRCECIVRQSMNREGPMRLLANACVAAVLASTVVVGQTARPISSWSARKLSPQTEPACR
jgi:hypothetical protein